MSNRIWLLAALSFAGCHETHKVSARVETTGACAPGVLVTTLTNGKTDVQRITEGMPWDHEFSPDLEELEVDVKDFDPTCTQVHCQISADGVLTTQQGDPKSATCKWHR